MRVKHRIGRYRLLERLGEGGHGEVYRAVPVDDTEGVVALKVVRPSLRSRVEVRRTLRREGHILSRLDHPGIVRLREVFEWEGCPVLVMDLLEGMDLQALQRQRGEGGLPWREVDTIVCGALEALAYAHEQGVVHRDLKPANVFCSPEGHITLTDFGVARAEAGQSLTRGLKGTLGYMAPERFEGITTPGGDVYALGLVAWELLSGRRACPEGDLASRMRWHREEGPLPLDQAGVSVPLWLQALVGAMVSPDPEVRPQDAGQVLRLRGRLRAPEPVRRPRASRRGWDLEPLLGVSPGVVPEVVAYAGLVLPLGGILVVGLGLSVGAVGVGLGVGWMALLWRRRSVLGGGLWALLWVPPATVGALWGGALWGVLVGGVVCAGALWGARRRQWPASVLEVSAYLVGLGVLSVQFWRGVLGGGA